MSVYVDDSIQPTGRTKMSHLIADTTSELKGMALRIGVSLRDIQHAGTPTEHYDIAKIQRERAIRLGAKPITLAELGEKIRARRRS